MNTLTKNILAAALAVVGSTSCRGKTTAELPLPSVPATLTQPAERAAYVLTHFWDAMDFGDATLCRNEKFMTQTLVNFLSVFPYTDETTRRQAVRSLIAAASADNDATAFIEQLAETYLYEPESPMYNEDYYIIFLEEGLAAGVYDRDITSRRLEIACKNRRGSCAADFAYTGRDGVARRLFEAPATDILLFFYDPDCDHCMETAAQLSADNGINRRIADGLLTVIAIDVAGDQQAWSATNSRMPAGWTIGTDGGTIDETGLYSFRSMPSIYLLDPTRTVILKDATADAVISCIHSR